MGNHGFLMVVMMNGKMTSQLPHPLHPFPPIVIQQASPPLLHLRPLPPLVIAYLLLPLLLLVNLHH